MEFFNLVAVERLSPRSFKVFPRRVPPEIPAYTAEFAVVCVYAAFANVSLEHRNTRPCHPLRLWVLILNYQITRVENHREGCAPGSAAQLNIACFQPNPQKSAATLTAL
ncbi:MAG TPA: hypothetical protein VI636_12955 [Candidatus Angelobacter sp.]